MKSIEDYITVAEAAKRIKRDRQTIWRYIRRGDIDARVIRLGGSKKIYLVKAKTLTKFFTKRCSWCKKQFKAKNPSNARFCCKQHRMNSLYVTVLKPRRMASTGHAKSSNLRKKKS